MTIEDGDLGGLLGRLPVCAPDTRRAARLREQCRERLVKRAGGRRADSTSSPRKWKTVESMSLALATAYLAAVVLVALRLVGF